ncbi:UNVERIFIED_CONTAM: Methionine aminopeptidase 1D, mitochondrial [Gekko kuhli]
MVVLDSCKGGGISHIVRQNGFQVCPHFVGHGIGSFFHGHPEVWHHANESQLLMEAGMAFTIEPIVMEGAAAFRILRDGWTAVSADRKRSAQFEHTVLITSSGAEGGQCLMSLRLGYMSGRNPRLASEESSPVLSRPV